jgi:hypothetical protein
MKHLQSDVKGLKISYEPWALDLREVMLYLEFADSINKGGSLPQLVYANISPVRFGGSINHLYAIQNHMLNIIKSTGCYEEIGNSITMAFDMGDHFYEKNYMLRIIPHKYCRDRMIKRGYYKNNKSLTYRNDFERSFQGHKGAPWKDKINEIKKKHPKIYK